MKRVLVFDLDDTLYPEISFVKSGFKAVAEFLEKEYDLPLKESIAFMLKELENGRGDIFDKLLKVKNVYSASLVKKCLSVYRLHKPEIKLDPETLKCFQRFTDYPKYIITDGNKIVQHNKLVALGLYSMVKRCFITHRHGVNKAKPSPYCMHKICELEKIEPSQAVYIGDNPKKDFVNLKPIGFKTIRILQGMYKNEPADQKYNADWSVNSLKEINESLLNTIFGIN